MDATNLSEDIVRAVRSCGDDPDEMGEADAVRDILECRLGPAIRSHQAALVEAITWLCVEGKEPPYRVPHHISGDLWQWKTTRSRRNALEIIREAVESIGGGISF